MQKLRNLRIAYKLGLVSAVLGIPIAVLLYLFIDSRNDQIDLAQREVAGVEYLKPLRRIFEHVPQHRGAAHILLNGGQSAREQLGRIAPLVDADVSAVDSVDQELGDLLGTTDRWQALKQSWRGIKGAYETMTAQESFDIHTKLTADVMDLMRYVADESGLSVDPDLDTRYLMEAVTVNFPALAENLGVMRGLGSGVAAAASLDLDSQVRLSLLGGRVESNVTLVRRGMGVAYEVNPALEPELSPIVVSATNGATNFTQFTDEQIIRADPIRANPQEFFATGTEAITGIFTTYDRALESLTQLLNARIARLNTETYTQLGFAALALLLAGGLGLPDQRNCHGPGRSDHRLIWEDRHRRFRGPRSRPQPGRAGSDDQFAEYHAGQYPGPHPVARGT